MVILKILLNPKSLGTLNNFLFFIKRQGNRYYSMLSLLKRKILESVFKKVFDIRKSRVIINILPNFNLDHKKRM